MNRDLHPARRVSFAELAAALELRVRSGAVARVRKGALSLYVYTNRCVYDAMWDDVSVLARGLVLDHEAAVVRATPFPKFFNFGERGAGPDAASLPNEPFEAYEKLDGSLAILFFDGEGWRVVTKGAFDSAQAAWAAAWLRPRALHALDRDSTYLFEALYPENRIVVRYDRAELVLLGAYSGAGVELSRAELAGVATQLGCALVTAHNVATIHELVALTAELDRNREGFVIRYASGLRLKLKGAAYRRIHAMLSDVTPLGLWRALEANDDLEAFRREIPEEFWADFDCIRGLLNARLAAIQAEVDAAFLAHRGVSDADLGRSLDRLTPTVRPFLFARRKRGENYVADPSLRRTLYRLIRPDGNVLAGYAPSTHLLGARDDG
ncbi:hypothetical protein LBMAG42_18830 [Deltaproteobacteria bacterium]|nr:hypothetical protein LBMAG42_18830 [Deltaproteobacteria bacterium]